MELSRNTRGDISADNRKKVGAGIEIRLPSAGQVIAGHEQFCSPLAMKPLRTILLVEDEEAVLEFGA